MTESTERLSSALADRYRILSRLGEGGMARQQGSAFSVIFGLESTALRTPHSAL